MGGRVRNRPDAGPFGAALGVVAALLAASPASGLGIPPPDWSSPSDARPVDLWRLGAPALPPRSELLRIGWTPREVVIEPERGVHETAALRGLGVSRRGGGEETPFERLLVERPPLARDALDRMAMLDRGRARLDTAIPILVERGPSDPISPWEIGAPSFLFELMHAAPPSLREESRLGLADLLSTGMTVAVAPGTTAPDWATALEAQSDPLVRGLSAGGRAARPASPPPEAGFVRLVVIAALGFGGLALIGIVYAVMRESDGPKKLRSRRFG